MAYQGMNLDEVAAQYNPRIDVPDYDTWMAQWARSSEAARANLVGQYDIAYGDTPGQRLDVFPASASGAAVNVFIHGGGWRYLDKADHTFASAPVVGAGHASVQLNYDLCPSVPLADAVEQVRTGIRWVRDNAHTFNADPERIYVSGHSAGAHLAAMLTMEGWTERYGLPEDVVKGAAIVSAAFDLEPMLMVPGAEELQVDPVQYEALSPIALNPNPKVDYLIAVGACETTEWLRQTQRMVDKLTAAQCRVEYIASPRDHHYSTLPCMANETAPIGLRLLAQMDR
ncbi:MAG: arylformamidase [Gammaproteobacteria bacterium]|jgi:arylformamidase